MMIYLSFKIITVFSAFSNTNSGYLSLLVSMLSSFRDLWGVDCRGWCALPHCVLQIMCLWKGPPHTCSLATALLPQRLLVLLLSPKGCVQLNTDYQYSKCKLNGENYLQKLGTITFAHFAVRQGPNRQSLSRNYWSHVPGSTQNNGESCCHWQRGFSCFAEPTTPMTCCTKDAVRSLSNCFPQ